MKIHAPYYSDTNVYLTEWPLLDVVIISSIPVIAGLLWLLWPGVKELAASVVESWKSF